MMGRFYWALLINDPPFLRTVKLSTDFQSQKSFTFTLSSPVREVTLTTQRISDTNQTILYPPDILKPLIYRLSKDTISDWRRFILNNSIRATPIKLTNSHLSIEPVITFASNRKRFLNIQLRKGTDYYPASKVAGYMNISQNKTEMEDLPQMLGCTHSLGHQWRQVDCCLHHIQPQVF